MGTIIKSKVLASKNIELKTRRTVETLEINVTKEFIKVFYKEENYYEETIENEVVETITDSKIKSYLADFNTWKTSEAGIGITASLVAELDKDIPGS